MYMKKMLEVGAAENGFVIEVRVPVKPKKNNKDIDPYLATPMVEKQYIAQTEAEVAKIIGDILPMLDSDFSTEEEFDKAFKEAAA